MREKLLQFMAGRNGNDEFNRFLLAVDMLLILLSIVFSKGIGRFLSPIALILLGLTYFRMLSRDRLTRKITPASPASVQKPCLAVPMKTRWLTNLLSLTASRNALLS